MRLETLWSRHVLFGAIFLVLGLVLVGPYLADAVPRGPDTPRTLILSFDGVSYDVFQAARAQGAFEGWPQTTPLVSTFPSMTNVSFTAIYAPFGMEPIAGYEMAHYSFEENDVIGGGPVKYSERSYAWRDYYQIMNRTNMSKMGYYFVPRRKSHGTLDKIEEMVLEAPEELMVAHFGSTDVAAHLKGNPVVEEMLVDLAPRIDALVHAHEEKFGRWLRIIMLSDHGNTYEKVSFKSGGIRDRIRDAGFRVTKQLEEPDDVVASAYGLVSYGALYTRPENAERLARVVAGHPIVNVIAWLQGEDEMAVISQDGEATVRWRERDGRREFSYAPRGGDPLRLASALSRMRGAGVLDDESFASEDDWLEYTVFCEYPDAIRRLADSLDGRFVSNPATVIFSIKQGYGWGLKSAKVGAFLVGGKLEGTHGGLDRESSLGFLLTNDRIPGNRVALRADEALEPWAGVYARYRESRESVLAALSFADSCVLVAPAETSATD